METLRPQVAIWRTFTAGGAASTAVVAKAGSGIESGPMHDSSRRLKLGLGTLLLLVAVVAVFFGAARLGYDRGYAAGQTRRTKETYLTRTYRVSDLVDPAARNTDAARLVELVQTTVEPASWDTAGGPASIRWFEGNNSLVVTQSEHAQAHVTALLQTLRKRRDQNQPAESLRDASPPPDRD